MPPINLLEKAIEILNAKEHRFEPTLHNWAMRWRTSDDNKEARLEVYQVEDQSTAYETDFFLEFEAIAIANAYVERDFLEAAKAKYNTKTNFYISEGGGLPRPDSCEQ